MKKEIYITTNDDSPQLPDIDSIQKEMESAGPWEIAPMPPRLIESPIDFLFAEHHRQRQAANILQQVADGGFDETGVKKLVEFLKTDFALHVADEELCFFPLLRRHCMPEEKIDELIERLGEDHKKNETAVASVIGLLKGLLAEETLSQNASAVIRNFAEHVLQHLALENAVLLPIACARLDGKALRILSDMMKERCDLRKRP